MIAILVSSLVKNQELAEKFRIEIASHNVECKIYNLVDLNLPVYSTRAEEKGVPAAAKTLASELKNSKGIVFVAPEYNGTIPPVFNNTIAWVSRTEKDWRACFNEKPALIATSSGGGGQHVLMSMRDQLSFIGMNVIGRTVLETSSKPANPDSIKATVLQLIKLTSL